MPAGGECDEHDCTQPAAVGWGDPATKWICLEHFDAKLKKVRELVDEARRL